MVNEAAHPGHGVTLAENRLVNVRHDRMIILITEKNKKMRGKNKTN